MTVNELVKLDRVTDEQIKQCAYGIEYFAGDGMSAEEWDRLVALRKRLHEIEDMEKAIRRARREGRTMQMILADCGHYTTEVMNASVGTACPNCYDRMSD